MIPPSQLAEWVRLAAEATPGPWKLIGGGDIKPWVKPVTDHLQHDNAEADAAFIAASRTAMGELLSEVERLQAALTAARHQLVSAFGIVRSHASDEHVQHYQRAMMLCDSALALSTPRDGGERGR